MRILGRSRLKKREFLYFFFSKKVKSNKSVSLYSNSNNRIVENSTQTQILSQISLKNVIISLFFLKSLDLPGVPPVHSLGFLKRNIPHGLFETNDEKQTQFFRPDHENLNIKNNLMKPKSEENESINSNSKQYSGMLRSKIYHKYKEERFINEGTTYNKEIISENEKESPKSFANASVQTNPSRFLYNRGESYGNNSDLDQDVMKEKKFIKETQNLDVHSEFSAREQEKDTSTSNKRSNYSKYLTPKERVESSSVLKSLMDYGNFNQLNNNQTANIPSFRKNNDSSNINSKKPEKSISPLKSEISYSRYLFRENENETVEELPKKTLASQKLEKIMELKKFDDKNGQKAKGRAFKNSLEEDISRILKDEILCHQEENLEVAEEKCEVENNTNCQIYNKLFSEVLDEKFSDEGKIYQKMHIILNFKGKYEKTVKRTKKSYHFYDEKFSEKNNKEQNQGEKIL